MMHGCIRVGRRYLVVLQRSPIIEMKTVKMQYCALAAHVQKNLEEWHFNPGKHVIPIDLSYS